MVATAEYLTHTATATPLPPEYQLNQLSELLHKSSVRLNFTGGVNASTASCTGTIIDNGQKTGVVIAALAAHCYFNAPLSTLTVQNPYSGINIPVSSKEYIVVDSPLENDYALVGFRHPGGLVVPAISVIDGYSNPDPNQPVVMYQFGAGSVENGLRITTDFTTKEGISVVKNDKGNPLTYILAKTAAKGSSGSGIGLKTQLGKVGIAGVLSKTYGGYTYGAVANNTAQMTERILVAFNKK